MWKRGILANGAQRGMTLLEIMITLAIIALVMGVLIGPRLTAIFTESKVDIARLAARKFANEAFPRWMTRNPGKGCPDSIEDLGAPMEKGDSKDPWGNEYRVLCGHGVPVGAGAIAIMSRGPDGRDGTDDDIKSW